jgi:hypothetical protein
MVLQMPDVLGAGRGGHQRTAATLAFHEIAAPDDG